jgi:hypothetical protein
MKEKARKQDQDLGSEDAAVDEMVKWSIDRHGA